MCGICGILSTEKVNMPIYLMYDKFFSIKHRGPEKSISVTDDNYSLCFKRLAINDISIMGDQPFNFSYKFMLKNKEDGYTKYTRSVYLMCNGEIYNSEEIKEEPDVKKIVEKLKYVYKSKSDCEVLLPLFLSTIKENYYLKLDENIIIKENQENQENQEDKLDKEVENGLFKMLLRMSGEFAFSIYDIIINEDTKEINYNLWLSRDRFGIRPLFYCELDDKTISFGSEMKAIHMTKDEMKEHTKYKNNKIEIVDPRTWYLFHQGKDKKFTKMFGNYYIAGLFNIVENPDITDVTRVIRETLIKSVKKRLKCDREIGCLLSGGFDSSLVSAIASRELLHKGKKLRTFSIGMKDCPDVKYAIKVSEHIGSIHQNIQVPKEEWIDTVKKMIKVTETYDITTIRATVGQYLISKWIKENTDIKVLLIGDGSDELAGGYIYFNNAPNKKEFHLECVRRLHYIHYFDVLRSDRGISSNGLEARVPFLDEEFVDTYLRIDPKLRISQIKNMEGKDIKYEKYLLRKVFDKTDYLPNEIIWRKKEAFSDGVSPPENSWHTEYKNIIENLINDEEYFKEVKIINEKLKINNSKVEIFSKEGYYYYKLFQELFPDQEHILPYYWMPLWVENATDPSARTLNIYSENNKDEI